MLLETENIQGEELEIVEVDLKWSKEWVSLQGWVLRPLLALMAVQRAS